jgi:8-oxo-dGTP pyrophosphatase MutT (NUDIX family)
MAHKLFHVGIKGLIFNKSGQLLLLKTIAWKDIPAYWDLPGGRIEDTQTAEEALKREISEELGINQVNEATFVSSCISNIEIPVSATEKVGLVLMAYKITVPEDSEITLSDEHTDYQWTDLATAIELLQIKYPKEFTDGLAVLGDVVPESAPKRGNG